MIPKTLTCQIYRKKTATRPDWFELGIPHLHSACGLWVNLLNTKALQHIYPVTQQEVAGIHLVLCDM